MLVWDGSTTAPGSYLRLHPRRWSNGWLVENSSGAHISQCDWHVRKLKLARQDDVFTSWQAALHTALAVFRVLITALTVIYCCLNPDVCHFVATGCPAINCLCKSVTVSVMCTTCHSGAMIE